MQPDEDHKRASSSSTSASSSATSNFSTSPGIPLPSSEWVSSVNFTLNGKVATDIEGKLNSDNLLEWHMSQAPQLADVYGNYQAGGSRNVAKALMSVVYSSQDGQYGIVHKPLKRIYMNGWKLQDKKVEKSMFDTMRLDPAVRGKTELTRIVSLFEVLGLQDLKELPKKPHYIDTLLEKKLIPGFNNTADLIQAAEKLPGHTPPQAKAASELRYNHTHREKLILIK